MSPEEAAETRTFPIPVCRPALSRKVTTCSPSSPRKTLRLCGPTTENASFTLTRTSVLPTPFSRAKTVTGSSISSSVETTRGRVACTRSGFFTATSFAAEPKARPLDATTITRTDPK